MGQLTVSHTVEEIDTGLLEGLVVVIQKFDDVVGPRIRTRSAKGGEFLDDRVDMGSCELNEGTLSFIDHRKQVVLIGGWMQGLELRPDQVVNNDRGFTGRPGL